MASTGRNEPCPCGSGKKYKKCCGVQAQANPRPEESVRKAQIPEILKYLRRRHKEAVEEAAEIFWDEFDPEEHLDKDLQEMALTNFWDWVVYDAPADFFGDDSGTTLLDLYIRDNAKMLSDDELSVLRKMRDAYLSLYEVAEVYPDEGLLLKDLLNGGEYKVRERTATRFLNTWDIIATRLLQSDGEYVITAGLYLYHRSRKAALLDDIRTDFEAYRANEHPGETMRDYLKANGDMFNYYWYEPILYPQDIQLATTSGEALILSKARFAINDKDVLYEALRRIKGVEEDESGFVWLGETENMVGPVVFGNLRIKGKTLTLETNSKERLERGKALIVGAAGDSVTHKADEFQDIHQAIEHKKTEPRKQEEIPLEVQQQIYSKFMREHYQRWLTDKIPALDGKTPMQAVKTKSGKAKVAELLKGIENMEEHNKKHGKPHFDVSWMWERLGIDRTS